MKEPKAKRSPLHIIKNIIFGVTFVILVVVMVTTVVTRINGGTPSVFGYSVFRVSSSSMEPELKVGDVILMKECDPTALKKGDIVTYKGTSGAMAGKAVTHRVVTAPFERNGEYYIQTKGDANSSVDSDVRLEDVMGIVSRKLGLLSFLYGIFVTPLGLIITIVLIIAAFFNEIVNFFRALLGDEPEQKKESIQEIIERIQSQEEE